MSRSPHKLSRLRISQLGSRRRQAGAEFSADRFNAEFSHPREPSEVDAKSKLHLPRCIGLCSDASKRRRAGQAQR